MAERSMGSLGESAAAKLRPGAERRGRRFVKPLRRALASLRRIRRTVGEDGAARWLLDNWYLAEREGRAALSALSRAKRLRESGDGAILLRCCEQMVAACGGALTEETIEAWLTGFQRALPLTHAEHALLLPAMKAAVVISLAALLSSEEPSDEAVGAHFTALRTLSALDLGELLERTDPLDRLLRRDPAGVYPKMDRASRAEYRALLARQARRRGVLERDHAEALLQQANRSAGDRRHFGFALMEAEPERPDGRGYLACFLLLTAALSVLLGALAHSLLCAALLLLPVSEAVKQLQDAVLRRFTKPRRIPRMALEHGVPKAGRTLCVISALLSSPEETARFAARLEEFRLCSRDAGEHLTFGILADFKESREETEPADEKILRAAESEIRRLNEKYGGGFSLFTRPRAYSESDGVWRGYERKRGALLHLAALLRGRNTDLRHFGDETALRDVQFLLTLDADTVLTPGAARMLIAAMLHPLCRPRLDRERRLVTAGYGLLHPRIATDLSDATATDFARIFAGPGGTDAYGGVCGELFQDRYDCGGFAGKGILDIDALLLCASDLPENRILSHDAIEGALLRGGYLADVELVDGFPAKPLSFYARLERWTRGDWQNLPWLFHPGLRPMDRFRLFDSLRRSLIAPGVFLAVAAGLLCCSPGLRLAALAALVCLAGGALSALGRTLLQPEGNLRERRFGLVLHDLSLAILQAVLRLVLLPYEAWLCASAAARAVWRSFISHRRCLDWQTAAQSAAAKQGGLSGFLRAMPAALIAGALFLFLAPTVVGKSAGALWLLSPPVLFALGMTRTASAPLSARDQAYLLDCAREIWSWFRTFCTEEDHFLPPDNVQLQPPAGAAHRTSPTNIGLGLVSALCADALGVDEGEGLPLAERMIDTMERLPRWRGHFYNWYHTITMKPLQPAYLSTVDSGNLAASLIAAAGAFRARGREDLAVRCEALLAPMDFSPLYDERRRLFRIGMDANTGEPSPGWYDLMSSEARLTGYLAVSRGDADVRHWRALSRAEVSLGRHRGMASWTGTMFEYLMPELFLPLAPESLLWESAKFCLHAQKKRAPLGLPWGVSESAFYALDAALHYRYKAHGVGALALCRGMDRELVLSPYSAFLALALEPRAAVRDLRHFERLGMRGEYGFFEALDCTPSRSRSRTGEIVRSVMAHHLGMSLLAAANALRDGCVRRWTMANPALRAHQTLLQERVPLGGCLLRRERETERGKKESLVPVAYRREGTGVDAVSPAGCLLSNGELNLRVLETGSVSALWQGISLLAQPLALRLCCDGETLPLFPLTGGEAAWSFTSEGAEISSAWGDVSGALRLSVSAEEPGFLLSLSLTAHAAVEGELSLVLHPALARRQDFESHPAFWRLGVLEKHARGAVLWQRLPRGDCPETWLALAADPPLGGEDEARWTHVGRCELRWPLALSAGETFTLRLALAVGSHQEPAYHAAQRTLAMPKTAASAFPAALAAQLRLKDEELKGAMELVGPLISNTLARAESDPAMQKREALWAQGISGDLPIILSPLQSNRDRVLARSLLRRHALLSACGMAFDLVFLTTDGGDYRRPSADFLHRELTALDRAECFGQTGGVHLASGEAVLAHAALIAENGELIIPPRTTLPCLTPQSDRRDLALPLPEVRLEEAGAVSVRLNRTLPRRAWSQVLSNGRFSCTVTESGSGDIWHRNARECRVTPWRNDPYAVFGPERLSDEQGRSLFADGVNDVRVQYRFGSMVWETARARMIAFVPANTDARVLLLETAEPMTLRWRLDLLLSSEERDAPAAVTQYSDGVFTAVNPRAGAPFLVSALCSAPIEGFTASRAAADRGQMDSFTGAGVPACFCASIRVEKRAVLIVGTAPVGQLRPLLRWSAAETALRDAEAHWRGAVCRLTARTGDAAFSHYVSGWAAYQAIACRLLARGSIYQSGGAIGFRDQLQDAVNLLLLGAKPARNQILLGCAHQFSEGDVCHWWHPDAGRERGVRTRISDDLLWLPWALAEYVEKTGDTRLCTERTPWLSAPELAGAERERYAPLSVTRETGSVLEHAVRALQCVWRRGRGDHGLLKIGTGDWNDGFDRVEGESVWLSFFFSHTAHRFADLLEALGVDGGDALHAAARTVGEAAEAAWDGAWYRRGYFADGTPLGSAERADCQIDAIAQSWAVLCPETEPTHRKTALQSAIGRLYDEKHHLVRLLDPPFRAAQPDPGYVRSYGPGFRENGGQYTHGAVWLAMALLREREAEEGWRILRALLPASHDPARYEAEPFVLAADVYAGDAAETAGWTWYTGAAGWYLRVTAEELFGLRLRGGSLYLDHPCLPEELKNASVCWRDGDGVLHTICPGLGVVDGKPYDGGAIGSL